jgi:hypothetical protein
LLLLFDFIEAHSIVVKLIIMDRELGKEAERRMRIMQGREGRGKGRREESGGKGKQEGRGKGKGKKG